MPQAATPGSSADEAWFYENRRSIEIYVKRGNVIVSAKVPRQKLADWIKRTEPKP